MPPGVTLRGDAGADEEKEGNSPLDCKPREKGPDDEGGVTGPPPLVWVPREKGEGDCCASMDDEDPLPELLGCPPREKGEGDCCAGAENGLLLDGMPREGEGGNDCPVLEDDPCPLLDDRLAARWLPNDVPDVSLEGCQFPDCCFGG